MAVKKILMLVGDYVEDYEAMVPLQILQMAGHNVRTVCPDKKPGDWVRTAIHDFEGDQTYSEKPGHRFAITADFDARRSGQVRCVGHPGRSLPRISRLNPRVIELVRHFAAGDKPIASICHGQQILAAAGILEGKRCTACPAVRPEVERAGGTWCEVNESVSNAYTDGNLVTAPAWPAHPEWMRKFLDLLGTRIET
jgi:protease I